MAQGKSDRQSPRSRGAEALPSTDRRYPPKVLVLLPDQFSARACLELGEAAANAVGGTMRTVHIGADPMAMLASAEEIDIQLLRETHEGTAGERLARIRAVFDDWRQEAPGREQIEWHDHSGEVDRCVAAECAGADLVVTPRTGNLDARDVVHSVLFQSHRLALLPPYRPRPADFLRHVMIGWKPDEHALHAVQAARSWLAAAPRVTVVCVDDGSQAYRHAAAQRLAEMDIKAEIVGIDSGPEAVADALAGYANAIGASCLLTGAYRHGQLLEMLLGRVTHSLLAHAEIPLLMMH